MKIFKLLFFISLFIVGLIVCGSMVGAAKSEKIPCVVGYSVKSMAEVDPRDAEAALRVWSQELADQYGFRVEPTLYDSVDKLVAAFVNKKVDFAAMSSIEFLRAEKILKVKPELTQYRHGKAYTKFLVLADAGVQKKGLAGLKNKTLSLHKGNPLSRMFLDTHLMKANLPPSEQFFADIQERGKESQAVLDVFFGRADLCVVTDTAFQTITEMNPQVGRKLQVIAESPDLIASVGLFRPDWPQDYKSKAIKGMTVDYQRHERGKQIMLLFNIEKMILISDDQLNSMRTLLADYDRLRKKR